MSVRKEKKERVRLDEELGVLLRLVIDGDRFLFDADPLPARVRKLRIGESCKVVVIREDGKVIGIKDGSRVIRTKTY